MKHLTRLSWNSNGWQTPSGKLNKCKGSGAIQLYECLYGFGWEEWLFHFIEHTDGYCYGFLQCFNTPKRKHKIIEELHLYTRKCEGSCQVKASSETYYVGQIKQLEVLGKEHEATIRTVISNNETMMRNSLQNVDVSNAHVLFNEMKNKISVFNVRFKKANAHIDKLINQQIKLPHPFYKFMLYDITDKKEFLKQLNKK